MSIQLLISTMHQSDYTLLERMHVASDAVVVNQCDREGVQTIKYNDHDVLWINTTERGLSKSRNMAIRNATADICMIADDDMEYCSNYVNVVEEAFARIEADIIGFQVCGIERKFKDYATKEHPVNRLMSMKMASVELAFKRDSFVKKNILFDELIGAGTEFLMGEENAMLFQCFRKRLTVFYVPEVIANLHIGSSTWFVERNESFFLGKGASFTAMRTPFTTLLILQWAIRHRKLYKDKVTMMQAVKFMHRGKKLYLKKAKGLI